MKKAIIYFSIVIIFTFSLSIKAQSWKYNSGGNPFDGKYKTASIKGTGSDYPYNNPVLAINLYNEESLNFYTFG